MPNIFEQLIGGDSTTKRLQKEIKDMEFKKQNLLSVLQDEITKIQQKIDNIFYQIGAKVYKNHLSRITQDESLQVYYNEIASLKDSIITKEEKKQEIAARYDEEIEMLKTKLNLNSPVNSAASAVEMSSQIPHCSKCGTPYTPGTDIFCGNCGQKLS